ncbi:DUF2809 domain-containing protein [Longispora sp. NPDC051575]|uniref:ribosomal maturation YjgA family protein n=1 Tax=Longispora sp. NPDC051575 TaxID=3154943 RepID=UPI00344221BF
MAVGAAGGFVAAGLAVRALGGGAAAQYAGTALYAAVVYVGVVFLRPRIAPLVAGAVAVGFCWLVELSQLTPVPAALSERSLVARLVLGARFDWVDVAWYPVGVLSLLALHWLLRARARVRAQSPAPR